MDFRRPKTRSAFAVMVMGLTLLIISATSSAETYKLRELIEAWYGDKENEFGLKNYDGECLGALCFDVGVDWKIYIYDGVKGNIKVYGNNGAFVETIKAMPWDVGVLMPQDIALTPNGNIYILCETANPDEKYKLFMTRPGMETVTSVPVAVPWSFCRDETGYRLYSAAELVSDGRGSVYLKDKLAWKSLKLVDKGKALSPSAQLSSLREGVMTLSGRVLAYAGRNYSDRDINAHRPGKLMLLDEAGRLIRDLSELGGYPLGTDSLGNVYLESVGGTGNAPFPRITKYSPEGSVLAVIEFPRVSRLTDTYGGGNRIIGRDGSIYEMIGGEESVRVRKWEPVKLRTSTKKVPR